MMKTQKQATEIVIARLNGTPQTVRQLATSAGTSDNIARKILMKLEREGKVTAQTFFNKKANKEAIHFSISGDQVDGGFEEKKPRKKTVVIVRRDPLVAALFGGA